MPLLRRWDRRRPTYHDVEVAELDTSLSDGGEPWYRKPAAAALIGETRSWPSKRRSPLSLAKV